MVVSHDADISNRVAGASCKVLLLFRLYYVQYREISVGLSTTALNLCSPKFIRTQEIVVTQVSHPCLATGRQSKQCLYANREQIF